ncbi:MAG: DUF4118 domain-containing protein, partial [Oscillospiraceae bacterium]
FFGSPSLTEKLSTAAPNLDIYIIPDRVTNTQYKPAKAKANRLEFTLTDTAKSISLLVMATAVGLVFSWLGFSEANIITVYILSVLITAIITAQRSYSLISSVISVLIFNFFFTEPKFSFNAYDAGYPATFLIMFVSAFITSTLAVRIKQHARQSAETAYRTKILLETNQLLQKGRLKSEILSITANQLTKLLSRSIIFYIVENGELCEPLVFSLEDKEKTDGYINSNEKAVAAWVYKNNKHAGATTNTLGSAKCLYLAVRANETVYGVVGIAIEETLLDSFEKSIMLSILGECALALENEKAIREREQAAIVAKNEQLRANLLRSISHDLRTPLTCISGNAGILLSSGETIEEDKKQKLYTDIYDDSLWLINLVENLLSVTRIEDGSMNLHMTAEIMSEVVEEAIQHINRNSKEHIITVVPTEEIIMAKMDVRLVVQVIINIVDNAIKYTPVGSEITIKVSRQGEMVLTQIQDTGGGLSDEAKSHIFEMFYTANTKVADSRRGMGLGLALCKSVITAHKGEIAVEDNKPTGTIFSFTLPNEEVHIYE